MTLQTRSPMRRESKQLASRLVPFCLERRGSPVGLGGVCPQVPALHRRFQEVFETMVCAATCPCLDQTQTQGRSAASNPESALSLCHAVRRLRNSQLLRFAPLPCVSGSRLGGIFSAFAVVGTLVSGIVLLALLAGAHLQTLPSCPSRAHHLASAARRAEWLLCLELPRMCTLKSDDVCAALHHRAPLLPRTLVQPWPACIVYV